LAFTVIGIRVVPEPPGFRVIDGLPTKEKKKNKTILFAVLLLNKIIYYNTVFRHIKIALSK